MSAELLALRAGAAALLAARGEDGLAAIVRAARVEIAGPSETWSMGARDVAAQHVALAIPAGAFATLTGDAARLEALRTAFAEAMRSPDTVLAELHVELLLPSVDRTWRRAYRDAPVRDAAADRPDPEAVLAGAAALLDAVGEREGAEILGRSQLEAAPVAGATTPLMRYVLRLDPRDRARTWERPELEGHLRRAVLDAARRAAEQVVVEVGIR